MAHAPRLLRTVRMFVDSEDCAETCVISQVVLHAVLYDDGHCEATLSDPTDPTRHLVHPTIDPDQLVRFLELSALLTAVPMWP